MWETVSMVTLMWAESSLPHSLRIWCCPWCWKRACTWGQKPHCALTDELSATSLHLALISYNFFFYELCQCIKEKFGEHPWSLLVKSIAVVVKLFKRSGELSSDNKIAKGGVRWPPWLSEPPFLKKENNTHTVLLGALVSESSTLAYSDCRLYTSPHPTHYKNWNWLCANGIAEGSLSRISVKGHS